MWYDRVTGELIKQLPDTVISGRYIVDDTYSFNGHTTIEKGGLLVNDGTDKFHVGHQLGSFTKAVKAEQDTTEFGIIESAILAYQEAIDSGNKGSFLIPDKLLARCELSKFEELLFDVLKKGHLQEIARRPRMELIYQEYLVPVSRAKKIAASANIHLASHSECWQTRTLTGVIPKQVLALESEDQLNIYENRVYVKLLSYIESYLLKRVLEVQRLEELFKEAMDFQGAEDIYFELRESIFKLWGEGFSDNHQAGDAASSGVTTLYELALMLKKVRVLKNSKLCRSLAKNLHVPLKLNMTNVLAHDQHYRHVARLWNGWLETQQANNIAPSSIYSRNHNLTIIYVDYCVDIIKRTLFELNFIEQESNNFVRSGSTTVKILTTKQSEIILSLNGEKLCFVPCFTDSAIKTDIKENQRILLTSCRENNIDNNVLCISPTNFYSLELLAALISKWLIKSVYKSKNYSVNNIPSRFIKELENINNNHWVVKKNSLLMLKPSMTLLPKIYNLLEINEINEINSTLANIGKNFVKVIKNSENLICCPCCGVKADESQWILRDNNCFSISRSNCNHNWEVNPQPDGNRDFVIKPAKHPSKFRHNQFKEFGRFLITVKL